MQAICPKCGEKHETRQPYCRVCTQIYHKEWRARNKDKIKVSGNKAAAAYRERNREYLNEKQFERRRTDDEFVAKARARILANGVHPTAQQCEIDECQEIGERHHDDYSKATEIRWLCRQHHMELHYGEK
jgi:hypothetical protein